MRNRTVTKETKMVSKISACILDCPDSCSFLVDSRKMLVQGNPDHPFTRGFICPKAKNFFKRINSPERITRPMIRKGTSFEPATWDKALNIIARRLDSLRSRPESILHARGYGYRGVLAQAGLNFFAALGSSLTYGSLCDEAGIEACVRDFGSLDHNNPQDLLNASGIVNWGRDLSRSSIHTGALVSRARKSGVRIMNISPEENSGRTLYDDHILIRPGCDRFLAAAVIRMLMDSGKISPEPAARTANWSSFENMILSVSLTDLLSACQVAAADARRLYQWYEGPEPTASLIGWGLQRHVFGGQNVRMINALALVSGNMGISGGGSYFNISSGRNLGQWTARTKGDPPAGSRRRRLAHYNLGREIEEAGPEIEFIWVDGHNVINQVPDSRRIARAFEKPFVVCVDGFLNDTAVCSDMILPPAFMLEKEEVLGSCLHDYVNYSGKVVEPRGSCRSDFEILRDLGERLDPTVTFPRTRECLEAGLKPLGVSLEDLQDRGFTSSDNPRIAYQDLIFDHPDKLCRLQEKLDLEPGPDSEFPLRLLSLIRGGYMHSQIPESEQQGLPRIFISSSSDMAGALDPGRKTFLATRLGRMRVEARTLDGLHHETVVIRRDGWMKCGHGPNMLIEPRKTDMGDCAAFYSQPCRIEQD